MCATCFLDHKGKLKGKKDDIKKDLSGLTNKKTLIYFCVSSLTWHLSIGLQVKTWLTVWQMAQGADSTSDNAQISASFQYPSSIQGSQSRGSRGNLWGLRFPSRMITRRGKLKKNNCEKNKKKCLFHKLEFTALQECLQRGKLKKAIARKNNQKKCNYFFTCQYLPPLD